MVEKTTTFMAFQSLLLYATILILGFSALVINADDTTPIPESKAALSNWFSSNVKSAAERASTLDPALVAAEKTPRIIKVRKDGSGDFKTVMDAVSSIPSGNDKRIIVFIGPGVYEEKIRIERTKAFITFYGQPNNMPTLTFSGTAAKYGTVDSASLIVESDYFTAANIIVKVIIYDEACKIIYKIFLYIFCIFFFFF